MTDPARPRGVLAFLGFNKPPTGTAVVAALAATGTAADDGEDCDEQDEDEARAEGDDARKAVRQRNALRGAGHRRGAAAERERIAGIMSGLDPARAEMALHLALNSEMAADKIKAFLDKAPAGSPAASAFERMMTRFHTEQPLPGAGGGDTARGPSLAGRMAELIGQTVGRK